MLFCPDFFHLLKNLRYRVVDGFWLSLALKPVGKFIEPSNLRHVLNLGTAEVWSPAKHFQQYDQLALELFQAEHINILSKNDTNPSAFIMWLIAYPLCAAQVDIDVINLQQLIVFDLYLMIKIYNRLRSFKTHSVNGQKISENRIGDTDYITAFDKVWCQHYIVSMSKLLNLMKQYSDISIFAVSSQSCEHCFGLYRCSCHDNNSIAGITQVIQDQALTNYIAGTTDMITENKKYKNQHTFNVETFSTLNVSECAELYELADMVELLIFGPSNPKTKLDPEVSRDMAIQLQKFWDKIFLGIQKETFITGSIQSNIVLDSTHNAYQQQRLARIRETGKHDLDVARNNLGPHM
ncbi:Conserved_hypothetical protein [Hexamita inflata]|uniref:Uncharacterized protein n=1 Tax=Hexamita inflata TaxID=28002 RepID=A0AA86Q1A8_9EUKA|nr:Conserved hypothetical protein [Hexamita inflata]